MCSKVGDGQDLKDVLMIDHKLSSNLRKVRPVSIRTQAVERLREAILAGELKPGERLVERQLGEWLGISQVSVREALQQLEHEGLVIKKANTATHVTELSMAGFREILEVRLLLEPFVVSQACHRMTLAHVRELQKLVQLIDDGISRKNQYEISRADFRFHQMTWHVSGNETIERILTHTCNSYYSFVMILAGQEQEELRERFESEPALMGYLSVTWKRAINPTRCCSTRCGEAIPGKWSAPSGITCW